MGQYNTAIVTQQGQQILAEAVGAQQVITFTSVKTSSHSYSSETDLTTLTGLQDIMQSVSPSSAAVTNGNIVEVTARFDNTGVQNEYQIQTIGLYGKTPNGEETLIAVAKAVTPDTMPDSAYSPIAYIYSIQLTIQSGESVAVTVNPAGTATVQDVLELQQTIATLQQNVNEQFAQLNSDMMIKSVESTLNIEVNQGGITLYKSGKVVQVFCDIAPKSNVNPLTVISSVPSGYFPNEKGFLGYLINQTTGQCVPIFIDAGGQMRTTEILGLEQGNIYYGAGCYVCQ